jgi:hypothetical protein
MVQILFCHPLHQLAAAKEISELTVHQVVLEVAVEQQTQPHGTVLLVQPIKDMPVVMEI